MIDLVYIVGRDTVHNFIELRYSIRSMVKHLKGFNKLFIVGVKPDFISGAIHIPAQDPYRNNPARNIYEKIMLAIEDDRLASHFICAADDHFLLKDCEAAKYPYYIKGTVDYILPKIGAENPYRITLETTNQVLKEKDLPNQYFNVHSPVLYNKEIFTEIMARYDWNVKRGYAIKSIYANSLKIPGIEIPKDIKCHYPLTKTALLRKIKDAPFFSTNHHSVNEAMVEVLNELYPIPSKWESS